MKYSYGWEKMHAAVLSLIGPESMHVRLKNAYSCINHYNLKPEHFPEDMRPDFISLKEKISNHLSGQASDHEAHECAKMIVEMYAGVWWRRCK
jgi:hypothetical protein